MKKPVLLIIFLLSITLSARAQIKYKVSEASKLTISGTSTIHDWTSKVNEIKGDYIFNEKITKKKIPASGSIIQQVKIVLPVKSIESPRGEAMDNKTYNALKAEDHPNITFSIQKDEITAVEEDAFTISVSGQLTIAGHTENVKFELEGKRLEKKGLKFTGAYTLNMTKYEVEPPSAMFGQIKTGEEVTIDFELVLEQV